MAKAVPAVPVAQAAASEGSAAAVAEVACVVASAQPGVQMDLAAVLGVWKAVQVLIS